MGPPVRRVPAAGGLRMTGFRLKNAVRAATFVALAAVAIVACAGGARSQGAGNGPQYTADGRLKLPVGFETWVFVGSNLGLAYKEEMPANTRTEALRATRQQFHNIYINPEAYKYV